MLQQGEPEPYVSPVAARFEAPYTRRFEVRHASAYADLRKLARSHSADYFVLGDVAAAFEAAFGILDYNPLHSVFEGRYAINGMQVQSLALAFELIHAGRSIKLETFDLSCDESSPYWIARVSMCSAADFQAISLKAPVSLHVGIETFELVVDSKSSGRPQPGEANFAITAISPAALLDEPFADKAVRSWGAATLASDVVSQLLGAVTWELPDWVIQPANLVFTDATPMQAARSIVEAAGGVIESNPDGTLICRSLFPVSVPQYVTAPVDFAFTDADLVSVAENGEPARGFNRVIVTNDAGGAGGNAGGDSLESVGDENDPRSYTIRAVLSIERPVVLANSGAGVTTTYAGKVQRIERETVEFIEGAASIRYAADAILSVEWQAIDLGGVVATGDTLSAATPGYSLAAVEYLTSAHEWRVSKPDDAEVQFILMDA